MGSSEDVERVARELARAWPEKPTATRAKTTPLRALGENAKRVLAHCEAHFRDGVALDAARRVRMIAREAMGELLVRVWDARSSRARGMGATRFADAIRARVPESGTRVEDEVGALSGDVGLVVCECDRDGEISRDVVDDVRLAACESSAIVIAVERCAFGRAEATRACVARETNVPVENVFVTYGALRGNSRGIEDVLERPPLRSEAREREVEEEVGTPRSAFALDDEDEDEGGTRVHASREERIEREEWEKMVRDDSERCESAVLEMAVGKLREVCLRRAEKLALEYEPLRSSLYAQIRGERAKNPNGASDQSAQSHSSSPSSPPTIRAEPYVETKRRMSSSQQHQPVPGIDMIKLQTLAINGAEKGAQVASQVSEKVGSFLNWMVSEESEAERTKRVEQERIWQERRKAMWEAQRAEREQQKQRKPNSTSDLQRSPSKSFVEGTANLVNKTARFVDLIDGSLGGDDDVYRTPRSSHSSSANALEAQLSRANARIRALEDALARHEPLHKLLTRSSSQEALE